MKDFDHAALHQLSERLPEWIADALVARESGIGIQIDVDGFNEPGLLYDALRFASRAGVPISTTPSQAWLNKHYEASS